jgi:hypothetical protein
MLDGRVQRGIHERRCHVVVEKGFLLAQLIRPWDQKLKGALTVS